MWGSQTPSGRRVPWAPLLRHSSHEDVGVSLVLFPFGLEYPPSQSQLQDLRKLRFSNSRVPKARYFRIVEGTRATLQMRRAHEEMVLHAVLYLDTSNAHDYGQCSRSG